MRWEGLCICALATAMMIMSVRYSADFEQETG